MAARKKPAPRPAQDPDKDISRILLEDIRGQVSLLAEAMDGGFRQVHQKIDDFRAETNGRFETLEAVVKQNSADIKQNSADIRQNSADIRALTTRVEKLEQVEERVTVLEQRSR